MIRAIALTLAVIVSVNTGRVLACELVCAEKARMPHGSSCHESTATGTTLANTPHDVCVDDVTPPAVTMQKANAAKQGAAIAPAVSGVSSMIADVSTRQDERPRAIDRFHAQRASVLRI